MKHTTNTIKTILLSLVIFGVTLTTACSWEIFDPLNQPTNTFDGTYTFTDPWWEGKVTIESYTDARDNEISAFWMEKAEAGSPALIYLHGIGGNLGTYASHIRFLYNDTSFSVFAIDYPASGMSRGNRSEEDLYAAARGALAWVAAETGLSNDQIVVYGFSLGAALAIKLGTENPTLPVVSDGGFTSYGDWMPTISHIHFVLPGENKFDNLTNIKNVQGPKLFIHGTDDRQNPFWMGKALYEKVEGNSTFVEIEGAGHMFSLQHAIDNPVPYALIKEELEKLVANP
jgi:pimeloyl-ACP methyl ester carboxylesterase